MARTCCDEHICDTCEKILVFRLTLGNEELKKRIEELRDMKFVSGELLALTITI
jgi:hypothetical protein